MEFEYDHEFWDRVIPDARGYLVAKRFSNCIFCNRQFPAYHKSQTFCPAHKNLSQSKKKYDTGMSYL